MKKTLALLLAAVMLFSLLAGCAAKTDDTPVATEAPVVTEAPVEEPVAEPEPEPEPEPETQIFTDSVGRTVELPYHITKISPSGALAQMFLIAIAPDLLVSVASTYSDSVVKYVPSELAALPEVGQFYGSDDLNYETIAAINPEVVIDLGEPKKTIVEDMDSITEKLAIPAVHITADLRGTPEAFRTLGKLLGREERGEELAAFCEKILAQTDDLLAKIGDDKVNALWLLGDNGTNVIAATSFHAEVFDLLANNIAVVDEPSSKGSGNETDLEQIMLWNPDFIIFNPNSYYSGVFEDASWNSIAAVETGRVYEIPFGPYNWMGQPPSINRYLGLIWLSALLYPDEIEYDVQEEVSEYYSLFYGYDLSAGEFAELTANSSVLAAQ